MLQNVLPHLHGHSRKTLADYALALLRAEHVHTGRVALHLPSARQGRASVRSAARRLERLLSNERLRPRRLFGRLVRHLWSCMARAGATLFVLLDETPLRNDLRVLKLSLGYEGRAVPLCWFCYRGNELPHRMPILVAGLLLRFARWTRDSPGRVVLMADRGLAWPLLIDLARRHGWDFLLRLQGQVRVRIEQDKELPIRALVPRPGTRWYGVAEVFKDAGWRRVHVAACWRRGEKHPWLLVASWKAGPRCFALYRRRMQQEESFRDEKSSGFQWQRSQIRQPAHADRLLLGLALATQVALRIGRAVRHSRRRRGFERGGRRELSLFQLGLRFAHWAEPDALLRLLSLDLPPPPLIRPLPAPT
jgi:hypothetical protein